ncbi:MAG: hypothetical protein RJA36_970 [Pseudomonadota bacterium]|jgi:hypothetical protein
MTAVLLTCALLVVLTTVLHYEALVLMSSALPSLRVAPRAKLLLVILGAFVAHAVEIGIYGLATYSLMRWGRAGMLGGAGSSSLDVALYFSAETFSSLGYGDLVPRGPLRLLSGVEALNGLLLIGWSASFAYVSMERFWQRKP